MLQSKPQATRSLVFFNNHMNALNHTSNINHSDHSDEFERKIFKTASCDERSNHTNDEPRKSQRSNLNLGSQRPEGKLFGNSIFHKSFHDGFWRRLCENKVASLGEASLQHTAVSAEEVASQAEGYKNFKNINDTFPSQRAFFEFFKRSKPDSFTACNALMDLRGGSSLYYKQEAPITPPHIILHYSLFKSVWDWLILAFTLVTCLITPYTLSFYDRQRKSIVLIVIETVIDVFFMIDTHLNFYVTFPGALGQVISDPFIIKRTYLCSWFLLDLLACLPYDILTLFTASEVTA